MDAAALADTAELLEYRCHCGRLLFRGAQNLSPVEIKCRRCSSLKRFGADPQQNAYHARSQAWLLRDAPAPMRSLECTAVLGRDGSVLSAHLPLAQLLGASAESLLRVPLWNHFDGADAGRVRACVEHAYATGFSCSLLIAHHTPSYSGLTLTIIPMLYASSGPQACLCIVGAERAEVRT